MTNSYNKSPEISSLYFPHHRPIETHSLFPRKRNGSEDFTSKKNLFSGTLSSFSKCLQYNQDSKENKNKNTQSLKIIEELENQLRFQLKENQRLQYLTRFMILNQKKREEMIGHLFEENRKLKQMLNTKGLTSSIPKTLSKNNKKIMDFANFANSNFTLINANNNHKNNFNNMNNINNINSSINNNINSSEVNSSFAKKSLKKGQSRNYRVVEENISHQHILNMTLSAKAEKLLYEDNEYVTSLSPILGEQDIFIDYVSKNDMASLINLYDNMMGLFNEHKSLYNLIYRLKKIIKAANIMTSSLILTESIEKIVDETIEFLECDRATVFILDEKKEELWSKVAKGSDFTIRIPMDKGIVGHVVMTSKSVNIIDAYADERFNKQVDLKSNYRTKNILCSPILDDNNRVTGAIQAINKLNNASFSKDDEGLLEILANSAGVILRNSLHYDEQLLFQNNLRHILKTGILLNSIFSYNELIPNAEKVLKNTMNVDQSKILLLNKDKKKIIHFKEKEENSFNSNIGIAGHVIKTKEIESISNAYSHPIFNGKVDIDTTLPIICMPILQPETNEILGVFEVLNPKGVQASLLKQKSKINGVQYEILQFFGMQLGQIITNMKEWEKFNGGKKLNQSENEETSSA